MKADTIVIKKDIDVLKADNIVIKKDIEVLKADNIVIKKDIEVLKADNVAIKGEVFGIKQDIQLLKTDYIAIKPEIPVIKEDILILRSTIEEQVLLLRANNAATNESIATLTSAVKYEFQALTVHFSNTIETLGTAIRGAIQLLRTDV